MKVKKIPQRTCLGCKIVRPKKELIRIVRTPEGEISVDQSGKRSGRGAYTCPSLDCLELTLRGTVLEKALEVSLNEELKIKLRSELQMLTK